MQFRGDDMGEASAKGVEIRVVAVGGLQSGLKPLGEDYSRQSGAQVNFTFTSPANLKGVLAKDQFDAIIVAAPSVEELDRSGELQPGSRVKAARVGIGIAVREGAPKPDLSTPDAFKQAVRSARNIIYTDAATPNGSGIVTMLILAAAGLVDVVKAKGIQSNLGTGRELIAKGEYEMGLFNISEIAMPGIAIAGPVPAPLQDYTHYEGAVMANSANSAAAAAFLKFITSKPAAAIWKAGNIDAI
jgi:molybdate transport system substrate-binding protein